MRTSIPLTLGLTFIAACAPSTPARAPAPSVPTVAVDDTTRDAFFDALVRGDDDAAIGALARTPALAEARSKKGRSAFLVALARPLANGFVRPQENRPLAAVLARHPPLDPFEAAAAGDLARVEEEIARDPSYVARVHDIGWTPLHFAAFGGQPRVVQLLLAHGAAIDAPAKNAFASSPLQVALLTAQTEVARVLVAHHADVRFRQSEGVTALHEAAINGDVACVRLLLDAGADPNARTGTLDDGSSGKTPLDLARARGRAEIVALLVARGAR